VSAILHGLGRQPFVLLFLPEPERQLLEDLGLNISIAILGINAGAGLLTAMSGDTLAPILAGSVVLGVVPVAVAWAIGRNRPLRMNLLMGAIAGGRCNSAGMRAAQRLPAARCRRCRIRSRSRSRTCCPRCPAT
jgi:uncharacterized transporter YbjL